MSQPRYDLKSGSASGAVPVVRPEPSRPGDDPYRYGWRYRSVKTAEGGEERRRIPLTFEDLLDPQEGDVVPQDSIHDDVTDDLKDRMRRRYEAEPSVAVFSDLKLYFETPGLPGPSPDVCLIAGVRDREGRRKSFPFGHEPGRPLLVIEVVSEDCRQKDYVDAKAVYEKAGGPEYLIVESTGLYLDGPFELTGFRLDESEKIFREIEPDEQGRLLFEKIGLYFSVDPDAGILIEDSASGERLLTGTEKAELEAEARLAAEEQAKNEAEAREALEDKVARLQAELDRLKG